MKTMLLKAFLLILALSLPAVAYAGVFDVPSTDKSMQYLGMVFGPVGSLPITSASTSQFSQLIYIFNQVILTLGIVIVIYTSFVGVIHTAQEGEVMGKKWSSVIIPFRAGLGVYLLLPSSTGYNWIQITVMWFIVQGVGAANALWAQVITSTQTESSIHTDTRQADLENSYTTVNAIYQSTLCMEAINNNPEALMLLGDPVSVFQYGDSIQFGRASMMGQETPICGSITVPAVTSSILSSSSDTDTTLRKSIIASAIMVAQGALVPSADETVLVAPAEWSLYSNFILAARNLQDGVQQLTSTFKSLNQVNQDAITNGWIFAGCYYFQIASQGAATDVSVSIPAQAYDPTGLNNLLGSTLGNKINNIITTLGTQYEAQALGSINTLSANQRAGGSISINPPTANKSAVQAIIDTVFGSLFINLAASIGTLMTTNAGDPIISMASFGGGLATTIELLFWAALIGIFLLWLGTSVLSCIQPLGHTLDFVLMIAIPIITLCITLLWAAGISLALYVPLIPYLVFLFSAINWIILVIEAMLGAPLIALTLIVPSEDEIGKAGAAIVILLGLFLRPALMIMGYILATEFLIVAIGMLNFGFAGTLKASISMGFGIFGFIALLMLYTGIAIAMVHEAFSLIYVLPDKTLRWMGGTPESTEVGGQVKGLESSVDKGTGLGKGMMKGALSSAQGMTKKGGGGGGIGMK